jgi:2-polyprenyl-3-methyl-5-hydroxy-6-metoxy-1,4-benzoquinol methylase
MVERIHLTHCPVCGGGANPLDICLSFRIAALNETVPIEFACCSDCTFVFQANPLTREALKSYYRNSPRYRATNIGEQEDALRRNQVAFLERAKPLHGLSVLDVGADMGKLLDVLAERGCRTAFTEDSEEGCRYMRGHGRHREIREFKDDDRFDLIIFSQVFEHIVDPVGYMRFIRRHLGPEGRVFIEIPSHSFWDHSEYGFSFEHVNYFSSTTLSVALRRAGFVITTLEVCTHRRYFDGKCKIVRAIAELASPTLQTDVRGAVKSHYRREFGARFAAAERLAHQLRAGNRPGLALFGAGELADLLLTNANLGPADILAIFDSSPAKHGTTFYGLPVRRPEDIPSMNVRAILILSGAIGAIRQTIASRGFDGLVLGWPDLVGEQPPADTGIGSPCCASVA